MSPKCLFSSRGRRLLIALVVGWASLNLLSVAQAIEAFPVLKDINADGLGFGGQADAFVGGGAGLDTIATHHGQDILVQTFNGAEESPQGGITIPVSIGENGYTQSYDYCDPVVNFFCRDLPNEPNNEANPDVDNATPPNPVWEAIGNTAAGTGTFPKIDGTFNPRVGLNNGNVLRFSIWVREDPNDPITVTPQVEPVLKFEFWKEALSTFAHTEPGLSNPGFGDKVVDQDQHLQQGIWIDLDGDGAVVDAAAASEGRIRTISSTAWTLVDVEYEVDDLQWFGIEDDEYAVGDIEDIRATIFWGDFVAENLPQGSLWFDNALIEVFADQAAANAQPVALSNPSPVLDEVPSADFDNDGAVDGADFLVVQRGFGITSGALTTEGDADYDGDVDPFDIGFFAAQFGRGTSPATGAAGAAIPEPGAISLCAAAIAAGLCRAGRRRQAFIVFSARS